MARSKQGTADGRPVLSLSCPLNGILEGRAALHLYSTTAAHDASLANLVAGAAAYR